MVQGGEGTIGWFCEGDEGRRKEGEVGDCGRSLHVQWERGSRAIIVFSKTAGFF